jgi:hypothetical protein
VSARNSRAAKAARRAQRQDRQRDQVAPAITRDRIAEAVHEAVCLVGRDEGPGHCDGYAFGGAIVLSVLTKQDWHAQGGMAQFGTGIDQDSPAGELCFTWMPSATTPVVAPNGMTAEGGLANGELHAWCARAHNGKVAEVADLAARHVPRLARLSGMGWDREDLPYVWGTPQELHEQRFWYRADRDTTNFIHELFKANTHSYSDISTLALWRLGVHSDRRAEELMHDPKLLGLMRDGYRIAESFDGGFIAIRD